MLDMRFVRENPEIVKENIKKKFQDAKLPLVDEVIDLDAQRRSAIAEADQLRSDRNRLSKQVGMLMGQAKKDPSKLAEAEAVKAQVKEQADRLAELEKLESELEEKVRKIMLVIPNIIDPSVPIGPDDSANVEVERFGEAKTPDFPIPYHVEIMESFDGIDLDAAGRVSGNGFYYLLGDIARRPPTSPSPTMWRSWSPSTASTWTLPAGSPATASTICWGISPGSMRRCWPMAGTS